MKLGTIVCLARLAGLQMFVLMVLVGCGGGGGGNDDEGSSYSIGGTVSGLSGSGLVLRNNGKDDLAISSNSSYTFGTKLDTESDYNVTVYIQPTGQTCTVSNATGTIASANVTDVAVSCADTGTTASLIISKDGTGAGSVTSSPSGINCGGDCSEPFTIGQEVTLTAAPESGSTFSGWSGSCAGVDPETVVSMDAGKACTATFNAASAGIAQVEKNTLDGGTGYYCALLTNGTIKCWGHNDEGQLGNGATADSATPVTVDGISDAINLGTGDKHACAVLASGKVKCWGDNISGQLGNGTTTDATTPVEVSSITTAVAVAAGYRHSCAVLANGTVKCWGAGLGNGNNGTSSVPLDVSGITTAVQVIAGNTFGCALLDSGTIKCWGIDTNGARGDGTGSGLGNIVTVSGISNAVHISTEGVALHSCAALADGKVKCWGQNTFGQIGNDSEVDAQAPAEVGGITTAQAVGTGLDHSCAVLASGSVGCWGYNFSGQLGTGSGTGPETCQGSLAFDCSKTPVSVGGISTATAVAGALGTSCALLSDSTVQCWGTTPYGELGANGGTRSFTPVEIDGLSGVAQP